MKLADHSTALARGPQKPADSATLAQQVLARCDALARFTETPRQIHRTFLSAPMEDCHRLVRTWMEAADMQVSVDRVGNLHGYYPASNEAASTKRLILASHLDTVPNAGKYDGMLGVVLALALLEALQGRRLNYGIEVIGFSDEEGVRYGLPFLGSRALAGTLGPPQLARLDTNNIRVATALANYNAAHPEAIEATLHPQTSGYLEFHIEQGPILEESNLPLGVVEAIAGQSRATFTFHGRAAHAGTTPMHLRRDALAAAAEWITAVEQTALATPALVATTGRIHVEPGAANVIPALARCTLDVRHASDGIRRKALAQIITTAETIAAKRQLKVECVTEYDQPAVALDPALTTLAQRALENTNIPATRMTSGAGHDAMILAPLIPTAMIFLRSPGGISHHPEESVLAEDISAAFRAGINFLELLETDLFEAHIRPTQKESEPPVA